MVMTADTAATLTPEAARRLAALLAPHLRAMRAVMADSRVTDGGTGASPAISPATTIFMTGMLDRISAGPSPGLTGSAERTSRGAEAHGC